MIEVIKDHFDFSSESQVYWNLNKGGWSIKQRDSRGKWIVCAYVRGNVGLSFTKFVVRPSEQARCRRERQKNVHAMVQGFLVSAMTKCGMRPASYNPYNLNHDGFYTVDTDEDLESCKAVYLEYFTGEGKAKARMYFEG